MTEKQCDVCNAIMFEAEPFKTTQQDIIEFAQQSSLPESQKQAIIQSKWIHPGYHCPNGCTTIFDEYLIPLPTMTRSESIAIVAKYSREHFSEFLKTHGQNSRVIACVFCKSFGGAVLEGESPTAVYRQPEHRPFRNKRIISAVCADWRIQELKSDWWYSTGKIQAECEYFVYDGTFKQVYKDVTGWSEYPPK